jgi:ABC-type cobalamin transport system permease subunit
MSQTHHRNQQPVSNQGQKKQRDRFLVFSAIFFLVLAVVQFGEMWSEPVSWKSSAGSSLGVMVCLAVSYCCWFYSDLSQK